jgi:acid phosphatase class B
MNISLDFDDTYTCDPVAFDEMIELMQSKGHIVYLVTLRYPSEGKIVLQYLKDKIPVENIIFTGRKGKRATMYDLGVHIHVWIDDTPEFIIMDAAE